MKKLHTLFFFFAVLWLVPVLLVAVTPESRAGTKMPAFALKSVHDGKIVDSSSFKGKVLFLTFFGTYCPPCVAEMPSLISLQKEKASAGFSVIGLSLDKISAPEVALFVKKKGVNYPVLMADLKTTMDFGGIYGIPTAFLVNKQGNVVKRYTGYVEHRVLEKDIRSLLN